MNLKDHIRDVPDFPKPGILFRDITPLLASHEAFLESVEKLAEPWQDTTMDAVAAVEARGFLFAGPLAMKLGVGLIPFVNQGNCR